MNVRQAESFVKQVAIQSFGSKAREGVKGGAGSIGMIGGKPVKFNTHWQERVGKATPEMIKSSNDLRKTLAQAATVLARNCNHMEWSREQLESVYSKLGISADGKFTKPKELLSRKVVAEVVDLLDDMRNEFKDDEDKTSFFTGVDELAESSKGVDTHFATLALPPQTKLSAENAKFRMEPWKMKGPVSLLQEKHVEHVLNFSQIELDKIMQGSDPGFGEQLQGDIERGGITHSFNGETINVPMGLRTASKDDKAAFMIQFKAKASEMFGGNEKLLKFYGNFVHQGCAAIHSQIKDMATAIGDPLPFYIGGGRILSRADVDVSKIGENKFRLTVSEVMRGPNAMTVIHDDGTATEFTWEVPSENNWFSYKYSLDVSVDASGQLKLSVGEPPVEKVCLKDAPTVGS